MMITPNTREQLGLSKMEVADLYAETMLEIKQEHKDGKISESFRDMMLTHADNTLERYGEVEIYVENMKRKLI